MSFEWSIHEYTPDDDFVPTGYYMQSYTILLMQELFDSASLAEGTFTVALGLLPRFASCLASRGHPVFKKWCGRYTVAGCGDRSRCCWEVATITALLICAVIFLIALFEFAESGFFSVHGYGGWLMCLSYALKMLFGFRLIYHGHSGRYEQEVVRPFSEFRAEQARGSQLQNMVAGQAITDQ